MITTWQPIETAPKGDEEIIVGVDIADTWIVRSARWVDWHAIYPEQDPADTGWWSFINSVSQEKLEGIYEPTHWFPMPD